MSIHEQNDMKTVLVTGCSSGIGQALALEFAAKGYRVIATVRSAKAMEELGQRHKKIIPHFLDVQKPESIETLKNFVTKLTSGRLDVLVNNAGAHYAAMALDIDAQKVRDVFEVNLISVMIMCQSFADLLIAAKGTIVQIGSVTRVVPMVWQSPYNATKAALSQYTKTLRLELEPFDVQVVEIVTGYVQSKILRHGLQAPANTRYLPIKDHIETLKTQGNAGGAPADIYARRVVNQVTRRDPPREVWEGAGVWSMWFCTTWLPLWLQSFILKTRFKLDRLRK